MVILQKIYLPPLSLVRRKKEEGRRKREEGMNHKGTKGTKDERIVLSARIAGDSLWGDIHCPITP
jgi:hypothetical protein